MSFIFDPESFPNEIWCAIFSYLDKKSLCCATLTCKNWFLLIRTDPKLSSQIILKNLGLEKFYEKVENSTWKWERWPVLKTIEFEHEMKPKSAKDALYWANKIKFDRSSALEKVIISVSIRSRDLLQQNNSKSNHPSAFGTIEKLAFNPRIDLKSFGMEHILHLRLPCTYLSEIDNLKLIGQNAKALTNLKITLDDLIHLNLQQFEDNFNLLFKGLNKTLKTLTLKNSNKVYAYIILKALSQNCPNLVCLNVFPCSFGDQDSHLQQRFKNLEDLYVPRFNDIDYLANDSGKLRKLSIGILDIYELKNYDISSIRQKFKNLEKFHLNLRIESGEEYREFVEWKEDLDKKVQKINFEFKSQIFQIKICVTKDMIFDNKPCIPPSTIPDPELHIFNFKC